MMSVFLVLSAYTHYYALLSCGIVFGIVFLLLLLKRDHDAVPVMAAGMIAAVLFLPWMPVLLRQMTSTEGTSWIGPITLGSIKGYIVSLFGIGGSKYSAVFFAAVHLAVFIMLFSGDRHDAVTGLCALRIPALTALTGVIVSLLLHPVFHIRYLTPCIPLICSFLTIALSKCRYRKAARIASAVIVLFGAAGYLNLWREEHAVRHDELDSAFVEKYRFCSCYVVETRNTHIPAVLEYYEQEKPVYWENEMGRANPYANRVSPTLFIPEENPSVVLFLNVGAEPSEDLRSLYRYDYIGTMHENSHSFDAYLLTLK